MSQASLFRLLDLYPNVPSGEWASFFGWEWRPPSQSDLEKRPAAWQYPHVQTKVEVDVDGPPANNKPSDPTFWYLAELTSRDPAPQIVPMASLAPDRSKTPGRVMVEYYDPSPFWRVELDRLLGFTTKTDEPDIDRCVDQLARCKPLPVLPTKSGRSYSQSTLVIVDRCSTMEPLYGWQVQLLILIGVLTGAQAMQRIGLRTPPLTSQQRQVVLKESSKVERVVLLTSLDQRWSNKHILSAWHTLIDQVRDQGVDVVVVQPKLSEVNKQIVDWIMGSAVGLIHPRGDSLAALSKALGGGLSEVMAVWNHAALTQPGVNFQIKPVYRHYFCAAYKNVPEASRGRAAEVVGAHRALKPDCQIAMESLLAAALGREKLPSQDWVAKLSKTVHGTDLPTVKAYFDALKSEYADVKEAFEHHEELSQLFALVDQTTFESTSGKSNSTDRVSLVGQSNGLKLVMNSHRHAVFTTSSIVMDEFGQQLAEGDHPGTHVRQLTSTEHRFTLANLKLPAWAERIYRRADGVLEAVHSEGARFELLPASVERQKSQWRLKADIWGWASEAGIDEHGLWAVMSIDSAAYRLRWIPSGRFMMGSLESELGRSENERLHQVTLTRGFWLGETTVSRELWQVVTGKSAKQLSEDLRLPMMGVNWNDCRAFTDKIKARHQSFIPRFPSEAEWEYACRSGNQSAYWWGERMDSNYGNDSNRVAIESAYPANDFGVKSMNGNVWEWCQDFYAAYPEEPATDPLGPETGQYRVLRGGGWFYEPQSLRSAFRYCSGPGNRGSSFGFRLAGGSDPKASGKRGSTVAADRAEGTEDQRGGQGRPSSEYKEQSGI